MFRLPTLPATAARPGVPGSVPVLQAPMITTMTTAAP